MVTGGIAHMQHVSFDHPFNTQRRSSQIKLRDNMCYDASVLSFDATSPTDFHRGAVPLYIQCTFARNVVPYFSYPKTIYIVSWCDCSSVGGSIRHLSVPGTPQRGCRRLHQIFGQGKQRHTGERGGGWERVEGATKRESELCSG